MEWKPPVAQGFAAWVGENGVLHRHGHPTNPLIALAGAIIKHRDASLAAVTAERDKMRAALTVPDVWTPAELAGMEKAFVSSGVKHGFYETLIAVGAWLLRHRLDAALSTDAQVKP
jgi:hypothetical protein